VTVTRRSRPFELFTPPARFKCKYAVERETASASITSRARTNFVSSGRPLVGGRAGAGSRVLADLAAVSSRLASS
jgi:hypothetical protein